VAIAIDATVVRCLAVPAIMALMGRAAWWLPKWLDRILPPISIEGGDFFDRIDAEQRPPEPEPAVSG
jgi:RND superfamily putative drug exporter